MPAHEGEVPEDHAPPGMKIGALVVLNSPASLLQGFINMLACFVLGRGHMNVSFTNSTNTRAGEDSTGQLALENTLFAMGKHPIVRRYRGLALLVYPVCLICLVA